MTTLFRLCRRSFTFKFGIFIGFSSLAVAQSTPSTPSASTQEKPRIYITESNSWETQSAGGGSDAGAGFSGSGGARPQTAEIIKTFGERCPQVTVNNRLERTIYVVQLDHEGGKNAFSHKNKVAVFDRSSGDLVFSKSTLSVGGAVQEACAAILKHWSENSKDLSGDSSQEKNPSYGGASLTSDIGAAQKLSFNSTPSGADIEINGSFVGTTPSMLELHLGTQTIAIKKKGYQPWTRKMKVTRTAGVININADLEKTEETGSH